MNEASVKEIPSGHTETYTGVTARPFKKRYYEHRGDTKKEEGRTKTALSAHIWGLNDKNIKHKVGWKIKYRGPDFNPLTKKCRICLKEKHYIMYHRDGSTLNRRNEIVNTCRHRTGKLLENLKT